MSSSARRGLKRQCLAPAAPKQCSALVRAERGERRGGTSRSMSREVSPSMLRTIKRLPSSPHWNWRTALGRLREPWGSLRDAGRRWASVSGFWPQALRPGSCFRTDTAQDRGRQASRHCASSSLARARMELRPIHVSETLTAPQPRTGASFHDAQGSPWESSGLLRS